MKKTIRGTSSEPIKIKYPSLSIYDNVILRLVSQDPQNRLKSKNAILDLIKSQESYRKQIEKEEKVINSNIKFLDILNKNFPGERGLNSTENETEIQEVLTDLNNNIAETDLYCVFGSGGDTDIRRIVKINNEADSHFWLLGHYELKIKKIWYFKHTDAGYNFILIEIFPMQTNEKFGEILDYETVEK